MWNQALCAALQPVMHVAELAFRNALYRAGVRATQHRKLSFGTIPCWLDARPTLLQLKEANAVAEAIGRLKPTQRTPGHLVAQLGLGFWVGLCNAPYEQGNAHGPQLWPAALAELPGCIGADRNRRGVLRHFHRLRELRNDIAHHQPVWDRKPQGIHNLALMLTRWVDPSLSSATAVCSTFAPVYMAGPSAYHALAAQLMTC